MLQRGARTGLRVRQLGFGGSAIIQHCGAAVLSVPQPRGAAMSTGAARVLHPSRDFRARLWAEAPPPPAGVPGGHETLKVLTWNVLADCYACSYRSSLYLEAPSQAVQWTYRANTIIAELLHWRPDIICLQEVEHYDQIQAALAPHGYEGVWLGRCGRRRDGCATFWRATRLRAADVKRIRFSELRMEDNVALLVRLQLLQPGAAQGPGGNGNGNGDGDGSVEQSKPRLPQLVVSNTHVCFDPKKGDTKLGQIRALFSAAHELAAGQCAFVLLAGDYNTSSYSPLHEFMASGVLDVSRHNRRKLSGQVKGWGYPEYFAALRQQQLPKPPAQDMSRIASTADTSSLSPPSTLRSALSAPVTSAPTSSPGASLLDQAAGAGRGAQADRGGQGLGGLLPMLAGAAKAQLGYVLAKMSGRGGEHEEAPGDFEAAAQNGWGLKSLRTALGEEGVQRALLRRRAVRLTHSTSVAGPRAPPAPQPAIQQPALPGGGAAAPFPGRFSLDMGAGQVSGVERAAVLPAVAGMPFVGAPPMTSASESALPSSFVSPGLSPAAQQRSVTKAVSSASSHIPAHRTASAAQLDAPDQLPAATGLVAQHPLHVASTYQAVSGAEPAFTTTHKGYHGCCDYVWFTPRPVGAEGGDVDSSCRATLVPVRVLQPPDMTVLPQGLPARGWGSDHISLVAEYVVVCSERP